MKEVSTIGLDLAKNVFRVHGVDGSGETVIRRHCDEDVEVSAGSHAGTAPPPPR